MRTRSFATAILCVAGCLLGLSLSPAATAAVPPFDSVRQIVQHAPSALAHSADGNTLYVAFGATLGVLDVTDRTQPALRGGVAPLPPSPITGVVVNPGAPRYVYASVANWIFVVDVAAPAAPVLVGQTLLSGSATGIALSGNYLFAVGTGTMWVLNVSAPAAPTPATTYALPTGTQPNSITLDGAGHAFLGCSRAFLALDVTAPAAPLLLSNTPLTNNAFHVRTAGRYAYVAAELGGLRIYDVSNPAAPALAGVYAGYFRDVALDGTYALLDAYDFSGLSVVNVADPAHPTLVKAQALPGGNAAEVDLVGGTLYVASLLLGVQAVDVSAVAAPALVGTYIAAQPTDLVVSGQRVFAAAGFAGLLVYDVSAGKSALYPSSARVQCVALSGATLLLGKNGSVEFVDVSHPLTPARIATLSVGYNVTAIAAASGYAFFGAGATFGVIDFRNPAAPAATATLPIVGISNAVALDTHYAYLAQDTGGLKIVDVANPAAPALVSTTAISPATDVTVDDGRAYVAANDGVHVLDVSTPANPVALTTVASSYASSGVGRGALLYVVNSNAAAAYDIHAPAAPTQVGASTAWFNAANRARFSDGYLYVSGGAGLWQMHYPGQCVDAYEPNDDPAHAVPIAAGLPYVAGVCDSLDNDWYSLSPTAPSTLTVALTPPSGDGFKVELTDAGGLPIAESATLGGVEQITRAVDPGTYRLRVYGPSGAFDATNQYSLAYAECAAPTQPAEITSVSLWQGNVALTISDPAHQANVTGFDVYRAATPNGSYTSLATNATDGLSGVPGIQYVDATAGAAKIAYYLVKPYNAACTREGP